MSQHDMTLDNASGLGFRTDANNALQALASLSGGPSAPSPAFPCQVWADTATGRLKRRNAANTLWLDEGPLDSPLRDAASQGEFIADTGAANAYVCNFVPAITARSESTPLRFKATHANTGACTINDGVGTVALVGGAHAALQGGEIIANGIAWVQWNSSVGGGGSYVLLFCTGAPQQVANATGSQQAVAFGQIPALISLPIGTASNVSMSVASASVTATLTADEIVVGVALGGQTYKLSNFSKTINLTTTGAGGMDTGSAPVSGNVAIYAIYNPATATSALLAINSTAISAPNIYGGANMPAGYTASALVSVWITNSSSQLDIGVQYERRISIRLTQQLVTNTQQASATPLTMAVLPLSAKAVSGDLSIGSSLAGTNTSAIGADSNLTGRQSCSSYGAVANAANICPFPEFNIITPKTIYYTCSAQAGTMVFFIWINGYSF